MLRKTILLFLLSTFCFVSWYCSYIATYIATNHQKHDNNNVSNNIANNNDGQQFRKMKFFAGSHVNAVLTDTSDVIWVSVSNKSTTKLNGLFRLDPGSITWVHVVNNYSLSAINSMILDINGNLLIGGQPLIANGYGLLIMSAGATSFNKVNGFENKTIYQLYRDHSNGLYATTNANGVYYQTNPVSSWTQKKISNINHPITQIFESSAGILYLLSNFYLYKCTSHWKWEQQHFKADYVFTTIAEGAHNKKLYFGTLYSGLLSMTNDSTNIESNPNFINQEINWTYLDANKILWVSSTKTTQVSKSKSENYTRSFLSELKNTAKTSFSQFQEFEQNSIVVTSMMIDNQGNYWAGTAKQGIFNGYWNTKQGYYVKYKHDSGICIIDPSKTYDEIFATSFQIILNDSRVDNYEINGKKYQYNHKTTTINFDVNNHLVRANYLINFKINYGKESVNNISQNYIIKNKFNQIGTGKTEDVGDIVQFEIGIKKTATVKYTSTKSAHKTSLLIYGLTKKKENIIPVARMIITVLNGFLVSYQNSSYDEVSYSGSKPFVRNTYRMDNFNNTKPEFLTIKNGYYDFHILDLVHNDCNFLLQVGGTVINPHLNVINQHKRSWFFSSAGGIFTFAILIFTIIAIFNIGFVISWKRKNPSKKAKYNEIDYLKRLIKFWIAKIEKPIKQLSKPKK